MSWLCKCPFICPNKPNFSLSKSNFEPSLGSSMVICVPFKTGSLISNKDSMILNPLSPKRCAYLFHCNNISVSVNGSVGK